MYIIGWIILIIAIALWRRDLTGTKMAYINLIGQMKKERMEFEALKAKYEAILYKDTNNNGKKETTRNSS
ncbi:MAG: hypothetical protein HQK89_11770 [Nitrospirae bacterium]|nr:hypothetical protein [Nitrospirota bacterium]